MKNNRPAHTRRSTRPASAPPAARGSVSPCHPTGEGNCESPAAPMVLACQYRIDASAQSGLAIPRVPDLSAGMSHHLPCVPFFGPARGENPSVTPANPVPLHDGAAIQSGDRRMWRITHFGNSSRTGTGNQPCSARLDGKKLRYRFPSGPTGYSSRRYVRLVICSETRPIRKMMTAAENNSALMLVNRCCVTNV